MERITFKAWVGSRYISIAEILLLIGRFLLDAKWTLLLDELAPGPQAKVLESIRMTKPITTFELLHLTTPYVQIIDGRLSADDKAGECIITIEAVDGSDWDIETASEAILNELKRHFKAEPLE